MIDLRRLSRRLKSLFQTSGHTPYLLETAEAETLASQLSFAIRHGHATRSEKAEMAELLQILRTKIRTEAKKVRKIELQKYLRAKSESGLEAEGVRNWIRGSSGRRPGEL